MVAEQLSLLEEVDEKAVRKIIVKELKNYRALKVQMENKKDCEDAGLISLFPSLRKTHQINELKVKHIERALNNGLDTIQREIIQRKYLEPQEINDLTIYIELGLKKDVYYEKKRTAILMIATSLGII
ncbi:ArpU family phage packaging/lysis transcriptional regulator [Metabacillus fastidiosus]|uniref:ArpU family phage packaging/lysis transcriptional regulator n=1 Tax=Metabacillus fastidiosus TaxID=1458 RepID=UPI002E1DE325|nr:ArpU family phage packaging/lysis transcriptional regulator [Metabacillus fastidiosus]MED4455922.1 ArpU family phage packaging/lysis transcriptional regulator [Metabacillus fastidiosus]